MESLNQLTAKMESARWLKRASQDYAGSMTLYPKIQLSRLREIGWKLWDPIGLAHDGSAPDEGCADEYDRYLLHVVSMISRGASKEEAAAYLTGIASEHMGLSVVDLNTAAATTHAIADYLTSLPDKSKAVR